MCLGCVLQWYVDDALQVCGKAELEGQLRLADVRELEQRELVRVLGLGGEIGIRREVREY